MRALTSHCQSVSPCLCHTGCKSMGIIRQ